MVKLGIRNCVSRPESLAAWSLGSAAAVFLLLALFALCVWSLSGGKQKPSVPPVDDAIFFETSDASIPTLAAPVETDIRPERRDTEESFTLNYKPSGSMFDTSRYPQLGSATSEDDPGLPPAIATESAALSGEADDVLPIRWRVGVVEPDFGVSELDFRMAILAAINMWESAVGKRMFIYDPSGGMPIELVCGGRLRMAQERYDTLKGEVFSAEEVYNARKQAYLELEDTCARYRNESLMGGLGASEQDVFKDLLDRCESDKHALAVWKEELAEMKTGKGKAYEEYRAELQHLKSLMFQNGKNENCAGTCYYDPLTIQIYKFDNGFECIDIIAHELGHALGLKRHVAGDPSFIMYPTCLDEVVVDRHITPQELIVLKEANANLKWLRELQIR